jgi:hypothetical protein
VPCGIVIVFTDMRFAFYYVSWHYTQAVHDLVGIVFNFIWFFYEFFSIPLLLKTLFSPFHRLGEKYSQKFDIWSWFQTFTINMIMRMVGFLIRFFLILIGIFFILLTCVLGIVFLVAWLTAPLLLMFAFSYGIKLISIG